MTTFYSGPVCPVSNKVRATSYPCYAHTGVFTCFAILDLLSGLCGRAQTVLDSHLHHSPVSFAAPVRELQLDKFIILISMYK